jgi:ankyrin repeat protein
MEPNELDPEVIDFAHRMFEAARSGFTDDLVRNLKAGLPPNLTNDKGDTLLMLAAYHDHPDTVRVLLEAGADTSRSNDRGQTALGAAVFRQNEVTVRALLAAGADPDAGGPTAREMAAFFQLPAMTALLDEQR